jgi:hypothetical protein
VLSARKAALAAVSDCANAITDAAQIVQKTIPESRTASLPWFAL